MELEGKNKNNFQQYLTREKLAVAGVQFGHPVAKQNPKMKPYIYGVRKSNKYHGNKMHFINLLMTIKGVEKAINFLEKLKQENGILLLVGIKRQTRGIIKSLAEELKLPYITER
jgi:small subunit ribosomal protein S2